MVTDEPNRQRRISRRRVLATTCGLALTGAGCLGTGRDTKQTDTSTATPPGGRGTSESTPARTGLGRDTFERLTDLEVTGGRLTANTTRQVTGTQCAALETSADGAWLHIPFDEPVDFSNARPACHVATTGTAAGQYLYADLRDVNGNRFRTRTVVRGHDDLVRVDFGISNPRVDDTAVDLERISRLSFRPGPRDETGTETVYLDNPRRVPAPDTAKVVFQFDDGNETDYTEALPILSEYDYPAISYVNTNTIGNEVRLDERQLRELQRAGWLIGSHLTEHAHLSEISEASEIERRVRDAKQWLLDRGFTEGARHFAYPYNDIDEQALSVVSRYHATGRVWSWQPVAFPSNPQLIPGEGDPTPEQARKLLDWAVEYGGVVGIYYHDLRSSEKREDFRGVVEEVRRRERVGEVEVSRLDELESRTGESSA